MHISPASSALDGSWTEPWMRMSVAAGEPAWPADEVPDEDTGDLPKGVDEDALDQEELDTDRVTSTEASSATRFTAPPWHAASLR